MTKIESNIPIPQKLSKYPFRQMQVGDSFVITDQGKAYKNISASCSMFKKQNVGYNFTVRKCIDGIRVWRMPV